ncbi:hypothetical protein MPTK1_3g03800 [Marchantia polymorpha subsp. ruderalis]|uniref:Uncharacterized protein n=2 Tax=Marchantia polymorpha TaxID=3197 RepID=A0AAF6AX58_MARPO|nr:hypothetical protein MARPO_0022s0151 [Marchantia polymorpha]BBN04342.1 hypothetical protein Mp_3g03800 [Marchantia polymorpha subsp. ruderalis]|eukprot:PTQ44062.1 hypothetical protein MARPO_0022s0151 [Marchantia polymorpha]
MVVAAELLGLSGMLARCSASDDDVVVGRPGAAWSRDRLENEDNGLLSKACWTRVGRESNPLTCNDKRGRDGGREERGKERCGFLALLLVERNLSAAAKYKMFWRFHPSLYDSIDDGAGVRMPFGCMTRGVDDKRICS